MGTRLTEIFLLLFCEKNSDGSKKLRLKGKDLYQRIGDRLIASDMAYICDFLEKHKEVNELIMPYNDIGDDGFELFCDRILSKPNRIFYLNIGHCDITEQSLRTLYFCSQRGFLRLKTLRLYGNKFGHEGCYLVALTIKFCTTITYLDIGDTDQTPNSVDNLFYELYKIKIKTLNISRVVPYECISHYDSSFLAQSIHELLRVNSHLVQLHVQKCGLIDHDIETLVEGLYQNNSILCLDLSYNHICDFGAGIIANWLNSRPKCIALGVAGNMLTMDSAMAFSHSLPFSRVRVFDISQNKINDYGLKKLVCTMKKSTQIRTLFLWGNDLGPLVNEQIERMLRSGVLMAEYIDVRIYKVDGQLCAARNNIDCFKHRYYDVMDFGCPVELKIKHNYVEHGAEKPRALVHFEHFNRFPPLEKKKR